MSFDEETGDYAHIYGAVLRSLDLAIVEWLPDDLHRPLSAMPQWFAGPVPRAAAPFLEHFVTDARRYLHDNVGGVHASDPFTVDNDGEELLLRARALKVKGRMIVAVERLAGASDMRPILRQAREDALEHEALADKARAVHAPLASVERAAASLRQAPLAPAQEPLVTALEAAIATLHHAAQALPPPRKRR